MEQTLEQQARTQNNDYSLLEEAYYRAAGSELVCDPYESVRHPLAGLTLSASVVIPAWNARDTLEQCLIAIEQSSFNRTYPDQLEVVVVDDGSSDGTWELLERLRLGIRLKAVQQAHHSRAHTQNTGIAVAEGDVIICCDADIILAPFSIEELVKRHQVLDHVMLIGFRGNVEPTDPRIQPAALAEQLPRLLPPFAQDVRLAYAGGWPESMCRDTDHLKRLGGGKRIIMPDDSRWDLPGIVYGALFSLRRDDFAVMDGYDERFYGWGCEDTLVGVRTLAMSRYIIPVYSAAGLHIAHGDRSRRKWQEFAANRRVFQTILQAPFAPNNERWLKQARNRIQRHFEREPATSSRLDTCTCLYDVYTEALADPSTRGKYLHNLGRYEESAASFGQVRGTAEQEAWALFDQGKALRAARHPNLAVPLLEEASTRLPANAWPLIELALSMAAQGMFSQARAQLVKASGVVPNNPWLNFLLRRPVSKHLDRATLYARQGDYKLAVQDYEAALIRDPGNVSTHVERARSLAALGEKDSARASLATFTSSQKSATAPSVVRIAQARLYQALQDLGPAKVLLEEARRLYPQDQEVMKYMHELHDVAAQRYPLPLARRIAERVQAIPGWFSEEEAELLIALVIRAVTRWGSNDSPRLVEIGSFCGRATVAMGLTLQGLGRADIRIVSVDEPTLGPAPDGRPPREVLHAHLAAHGLKELVMCAPEEDPLPWGQTSRLILVDGQHDYLSVRSDVERYVPGLSHEGFLLFHDYADYFPDVQRAVEELLVQPNFEFVAQAGSLIALMRCSESPLSSGH